MAGREHELVAERMLRASIVVAQTTQLRAGEMHRNVVRGVRQRAAEVTGLRVIAKQRERHAGEKPDILQLLFVFGGQGRGRRRRRLNTHLRILFILGGFSETDILLKSQGFWPEEGRESRARCTGEQRNGVEGSV